MKNNDDKNIEKLVNKMMSESVLESPSINFTSTVMSEVLSVEKSKALVYKPVISRKAWLIIFASIIALFSFLLLNTKSEASAINFDLSIFRFDKIFTSLPAFHISSMTTNVLLAAGIMLLIQIFFLKSYLNKRFQK